MAADGTPTTLLWHNCCMRNDTYSHLLVILAAGFFRLQLNNPQTFVSQVWILPFMETCLEPRTGRTGTHQQQHPRDVVFCSSMMAVACQSLSPKLFVKTLEIPKKFIKQLLKHLLNALSFRQKRSPWFWVFSSGSKGEVEEEVKDRSAAIVSAAVVQRWWLLL